MIAKPPKSRTTRGRFFFNRAQRDFSLGSHFVDVLGHLGVFASLGQQPGDVQIGLPPCLVVNFPFDGGKACWITHQAIQPLRLAFGQQPSRLVRDGGWRGCRRAVGTLTLSSSFFLVPAHLHFRLQKHFHNGLFPSCQSPVLFSLRPFAYLNTCALRCVTAFWDRTRRQTVPRQCLVRHPIGPEASGRRHPGPQTPRRRPSASPNEYDWRCGSPSTPMPP